MCQTTLTKSHVLDDLYFPGLKNACHFSALFIFPFSLCPCGKIRPKTDRPVEFFLNLPSHLLDAREPAWRIGPWPSQYFLPNLSLHFT